MLLKTLLHTYTKRSKAGGSILMPLIEAVSHLRNTVNPITVRNAVTGLAGLAGLAYGGHKLAQHLKKKGDGLLGPPGYQRVPAYLASQRI